MDAAYQIVVLNGLYLPAQSCNWFTKKVMLAMVAGEVFCPRFDEVLIRGCPKPPLKIHVFDQVNQEIKKQFGPKKMLVATNPGRLPDLKWLLDCLSTLNPNHKFFAKSFNPNQKEDHALYKQYGQLIAHSILDDPFFKDLPIQLLISSKSLKGIVKKQPAPKQALERSKTKLQAPKNNPQYVITPNYRQSMYSMPDETRWVPDEHKTTRRRRAHSPYMLANDFDKLDLSPVSRRK